MKKIIIAIIGVISILGINVKAYEGSIVGDSSACLAFSDSFKTITRNEGNYEYKSCFRAVCSGGNYVRTNMVTNSGYRCQNGNANPYVEEKSDGCSSLQGACQTNEVKYCTRVKYVDCNRTSANTPYNDPYTTTTTTSTTTVAPTTKPTTKVTTVTTTQTITTTTTVAPTTTTTTTEKTTTEKKLSSNTNIKKITFLGKDVKVTDKDEYNLKMSNKVKDLDLKLELKDSKATYEITDLKTEEDVLIATVVITAEDGTTRTLKFNIEIFEEKSNNCKIASLTVKDKKVKLKNNKYDYKVNITEDDKSLDIELTTEDELTEYLIRGNKDIQNGSKITIELIAEDGTNCTYTIKTVIPSKVWLYILITLITIGLIVAASYGAFRYIKRSKNDYKYE